MRKYTLLIVIMMLSTGLASAQKAQYNFGIKVGCNLSNVADNDSRLGLLVGAVIEGMKRGGIATSGELLYSGQGYGFNGVKVNLSYMMLPLMVNWNFYDGFLLKAGIQPGILIAAKYKGAGNEISGSSVRDNFESLDFSIPMGISYTAPTGVMAEVRYNVGLKDVSKHVSSTKNKVVSFAVGYKF